MSGLILLTLCLLGPAERSSCRRDAIHWNGRRRGNDKQTGEISEAVLSYCAVGLLPNHALEAGPELLGSLGALELSTSETSRA